MGISNSPNCCGELKIIAAILEAAVSGRDIRNVGLMENRATLRISSQYIADRLRHGGVSPAQVRETSERMAAVVDGQNAADPFYQPMAGRLDRSAPYQVACDLVFRGSSAQRLHTEPLLHAWRLTVKCAA